MSLSFVLVSDGYDAELAGSLESSGGFLLTRPVRDADLDRSCARWMREPRRLRGDKRAAEKGIHRLKPVPPYAKKLLKAGGTDFSLCAFTGPSWPFQQPLAS